MPAPPPANAKPMVSGHSKATAKVRNPARSRGWITELDARGEEN